MELRTRKRELHIEKKDSGKNRTDFEDLVT